MGIRRTRRSLTPDEVSQLAMTAMMSGQRVQGYDGLQRSRAYLLPDYPQNVAEAPRGKD
jgi:hypothetical protein